MLVGIYARKSTDDSDRDEDARSTTRQVERAREFAEARGWKVSEAHIFVDENISGQEFKRRPGLKSLLASLADGHTPFGALIVSEVGRLGRGNPVRTLSVVQQLEDANVAVWGYLDGKQISATEDLIAQFVKAYAAESESERGSQRVRDAMRRRAEKGAAPPGRLFGYETRQGKRVINPAEAAIVLRVYKRRAAGWGFYKIASELNGAGVLTSRGKQGWAPSQVGEMLRNVAYTGRLLYGRTRQVRAKGTRRTVKSPDAVIERQDETLRIIPERLWRAVQQINRQATEATWRNAEGRLLSRPAGSKWLLAPFMSCGFCNGSMHVRTRGHGHRYYMCTRHHLRGLAGCKNRWGLRQDWADARILQQFDVHLKAAAVGEIMQEMLDEMQHMKQDPVPLRAEAGRLKTEVTRLVEALARGDVAEIHDAIRAKKSRLTEIDHLLSGIGAMKQFDWGDVKARLDPVLEDWRAHIKRNPTTAQQVLSKLLPRKITAIPIAAGKYALRYQADYSKLLGEVFPEIRMLDFIVDPKVADRGRPS